MAYLGAVAVAGFNFVGFGIWNGAIDLFWWLG